MTTALIGSTGFVGGNLQRQATFDDGYHSRNIESLAGKHYDLIVCAGAPAVKWKANREPDEDRAQIERLVQALGAARAAHVVLISTVDVYPVPIEVDENSEIDPEGGQPYGRHRFLLERFIADRFEHTIIRLPGLFGRGLKKNIIYDFLHQNAVDAINADSVFQFYHLDALWEDIARVRDRAIRLVNFATEPTSVREIAREAFGRAFENAGQGAPARYDFRTTHAGIFDKTGGYIRSKPEVLEAMRQFVAEE
ncbi:MAG: pyridine nucleotide transhydrogenase [Gemmatimonadota bacterium]